MSRYLNAGGRAGKGGKSGSRAFLVSCALDFTFSLAMVCKGVNL